MAGRKATKAPSTKKAAMKTKAAAKGSKALPSLKIDKARKARWELEIDLLRQAKSGEAESWDDLYEALGRILDEELYLAGSFKTERAFLKSEMPGQDERTVKQYVRVARSFEPPDEQQHGIAKLDALLDYLEAAGGGRVAPAKINLGKQWIRLSTGDKLAFTVATRDQIRQAARAAKGDANKLPSALSPVVKAIKQALAKAGAGGVAVRMSRGLINLGGVPPRQVNAVGKALAGAKLPLD